jgi:hypothetical protein
MLLLHKSRKGKQRPKGNNMKLVVESKNKDRCCFDETLRDEGDAANLEATCKPALLNE